MTNAGRVLLIPKGDYNAATTYTMLDVVYYEGRSYVCKQTSTGNLPTNTTYWQAMTEADADKMNTTNPTGTGSFSLNRKANTTIGSNSFAEGSNTTASGSKSHAEGETTIASGEASHAEGQDTTASGNYSHAEGTTNVASGYGSHAEGLGVTASGVGCHAEGNYTVAGHQFQHVCGKNNDNKATTLFEVGNGADPEYDRSNAFEVYSDGTLSTDNGTTKVKLETLVSQNQALTNYVTENNVKNILPNGATSQTINGVTYTVNSDGSITANGTASGNSDLFVTIRSATLKKGSYILSGGVDGGENNKYKLQVADTNLDNIAQVFNSTPLPFTLEADTAYGVRIRVYSGKTINGTFKPMITEASITDPTYQPYAKTNVELTQDKIDLASLQTVVAASSDFADFQTRIAAL